MFNNPNAIETIRKSIGTWLVLAKAFLNENQKIEFLYSLLIMICKEVNLDIPKTIECFKDKYEKERGK